MMSLQKAASAGVWSAIDIVLRQVVAFVVSVILARLLAPEEFGVIVLLAFFSNLSIVFVQGGFSVALVQQTESTHEEESTIFWCNLIAGIVFALFLIAIAPAAARFYEVPAMAALMYVAAAQVVLSALGAVQSALLTRALRFDQLTKTGVVSSLLSGAAGIAAASGGWGVWALGVQLLVMAATNTAALWWVSDWRPATRFRLASIRRLFRFGAHISASSILDVVYSNFFILIIGKFYGPRDVGFLSRATTFHFLPTGIISAIIARTALPLFAARAEDKEALLRGFRKSISLAMVLSTPLMFGMAVLADLIILVVLGAKWLPAAPVLAIGALGGALFPLHLLNMQLLLSRGRSREYLSLEIKKKVAGVACFGVGVFYGIVGFAYAGLVHQVISLYYNTKPAREALDFGPVKQLHDVRGVLAAATFMAVVVYVAKVYVDVEPKLELGILVGAGVISYLGIGFALRLTDFTDALATARLVARRGPVSDEQSSAPAGEAQLHPHDGTR